MHDEELAARAVGAHAARHADDAAGMLDGVVDAVGGKFALDAPARAAGAVPQRAAALDHETADDAVEGQAVVKALIDQLLEVLTGEGGSLLVQLDVDHAAVFHSNTNHIALILLYHCARIRADEAENRQVSGIVYHNSGRISTISAQNRLGQWVMRPFSLCRARISSVS